MTLSYYNQQAINSSPKLFVCKPSKETIDRVKDYYNASLTMRFSALNTFNFTIPAVKYTGMENVLTKNPVTDSLRERNLIRLEWMGGFEYFVIMKIEKFMEQDGFESISYQCYSLGVQIASTLIRSYEEEAKNLSYHVKFMLAETNWKLDYVDADFDLIYRTYEMSSGNALQCIFDLCEKFNAAVVFNTDKKTISFHHPKNVGKNRGLKLKKGKYLETFNVAIDAEAMVTRLKPYGADGLDIRRLSPTGSDYIEDYSFFMYPFSYTGDYVVTRPSRYMSNELCIAMVKYSKKLENLQGQFDTLVSQATTKREEIQKAEQQLSTYEASERDLLNQRDVINATYAEDAPNHREWQDVIARLTAVQSQIASQKQFIEGLNSQLDTINASIAQLREEVKTENNFSGKLIEEWKEFQHTKEYYNDAIIEDDDLLKEAETIFEEWKQPPVVLSLSMEDIRRNVDINLDYDKLNIGDLISLKSENLNVNVTAKITEITTNFENNSVSITVANTESYDDDYSKFIESLNLSSTTSTTVERDKWDWDKGREAYDDVTELLENAFDSAKQLITGGLNGSVTLSERGLVSVDLREKSTWLMITNGQLFITPDNGNTVSVAISKNGVHAERLVGRIILGNKLWIEDSIGVVSIQSGTISIYDDKKALRVHLGRYPDPDNAGKFKYGFRAYKGAFDIRTDEGRRGVQIDENGIRAFNNNGVVTFEVVARTGEVKIAGSLSIKTHPDSNRGVVIDGDGIRGYNASGGIVFQIDNYGNAWFAGRLQSATGSVDNLDGTFKGDLVAAGGTFTGTLYGVDGVFTGSLSAVNGTFTGDLIAARGTFDGLVTGSLSTNTMRAISIDADQIVSGYIRANRLDVDELSAISANLGYVTSGTIDIDTDLSVGRNIYLGKRWASDFKSIVFSGSTQITGNWNKMTLSAMEVSLDASYIVAGNSSSYVSCYGTWDFSGARVTGLR